MLIMVNLSGDSLDQKATSVIQLGILIMAGILSVPSFVISDPAVWVKVALALALMTSLLIISFSILALLPQNYEIPGAIDWDEIHDQYIRVESEACFDQILSDYLHSIRVFRERNARKARLVKCSLSLLILQVVGAAALALALAVGL